MRTIRLQIYFVVALVMSLSSCSDWLELEPQDDITVDDYWKSKEDIRMALNAGYQKMQAEVNTMFLWGEIRSDFVKYGNNIENHGKAYKRIMNLEILDNNEVLKWGGMYQIINYANTVLKYAPSVRASDLSLTAKELNSYLAEAYFQRSLAYFYLLRTFGEVPMQLEPTDTDKVNVYLPKSSEAEILAQLEKDLEWAERYAPRGFSEVEPGKAYGTKAAVRALLADIFLWDEKYDKSILYCDKVINASTYSLMAEVDPNWTEEQKKNFNAESEYLRIFKEGNVAENILEVQFSKPLNQFNSYWKLFGGSDGSNNHEPAFEISDQVAELYGEDDLRISALVLGDDDLTTQESILKFEKGDLRDANWIIYRYADILLMKAESLLETGDTFGAQKLLNQVRNRAGLGPKILNGSLEDSEDAILQERALEFAFEGKRWFDLLRCAKRGNYKRSTKIIDVMISRVDPAEAPKWKSLLSDPDSYYLPIHIDELRSNPQLKQNPYYE
ncbi:membrane protein [Fulvitalea axinellae]|uniref:Membrane protein n=1 Tax=Fulvitalea axinellae TaxID=1182444 RepID=A0AAU9CNX9_9BACT|nr:membrane protein [Fulvitalea axinellae]